MKMWHNLKVSALFTGILISLLVLSGCDPVFGMYGTAYEWVDAPPDAVSSIYITDVYLGKDIDLTIESMQQNASRSMSVVPLGGVEVAAGSVFAVKRDLDKGYRFRTTSNVTGDIHGFWVDTTGKDAMVRASKPGYIEVTGKLDPKHNTNLVIVAVLVKKR